MLAIDWLLLFLAIVGGMMYGGMLYVARGWVVLSIAVWIAATLFLLITVGIIPL